MQDLFKTFKGLQKPQDAEGARSFAASVIEDLPHSVAIDANGFPVLLLHTLGGSEDTSVRLEHLVVEPHVRCRVMTGARVDEGFFTVITCRDNDDELAKYFLRVIQPIINDLGVSPSASQVKRAIDHLVDLFRVLSQPPTRSVNGLWAELFVIANSNDVASLVRAWHVSSDEKYDFSDGSQRIEVKSNAHRDRIHHFALEQLSPPSGCRVVIVSIFTSKSAGGTSLQDLVNEIVSGIDDAALLEKIDAVVAKALGNTIGEAMSLRFDRQLALDSFRIYDVESVPRIQPPLPSGVSEVHFKADLTNASPLGHAELNSANGIIARIL